MLQHERLQYSLTETQFTQLHTPAIASSSNGLGEKLGKNAASDSPAGTIDKAAGGGSRSRRSSMAVR